VDSTTQDVRAACAAAADAAEALPLEMRSTFLRAAAAALTDAGTEIVRTADEESHLGTTRLANELVRTTTQLEMFADVVDEGSFLEAVMDRPTPARPDVRRMLRPIGPVAVFAASNFPLAFSVAGGDTASALAAGCPVVVKVHEGHPRLSTLVATVLSEVLPPGVISLVYGRSAGRDLVLDEAITAVGFTGSTAGGRALFDLACQRPDPVPFYGELGSVNPVVVAPTAALARRDAIISGYVASFTLGHGQFCTKPGLLFLPAGHDWEQDLRAALPSEPAGAMLGPWVADGYARSLDGLRSLSGVRDISVGTAPAPTLLSVPASEFDSAAAIECFGPASLIVEYGSTDELFAALALVPGSLTMTVHGDLPGDADLAARLVGWAERNAGRLIWNGWPTGVAVTWAMHHGGPWPATTSVLHTSVGATAIRRFLRPVAYQDVPDELLPAELRDENPLGLPRRVDGVPFNPSSRLAAGR
jgi:NADP-dependent aldehyde dehydrogenase